MGTDIHWAAQRKVDGKWQDIDTPDNNRSYFLFAWLADVRNGYGFAGCQTHTPVKPLTSHRGLPEDFEVSAPDDNGCHDGIWMGDHSFGWATSTEILAHERPNVSRIGYVTVQDYKALKESGTVPCSWCGLVAGNGIVTCTADEFERGLFPNATHIQAHWEDEFPLQWFIDYVAAEHAKGEFRLVFGFDS